MTAVLTLIMAKASTSGQLHGCRKSGQVDQPTERHASMRHSDFCNEAKVLHEDVAV
eukprot:CAMPEP_0172862484 /NCGR_PEP_ID=MMETSP1075-20121228/74365_1 /TAXON_ID=2916 /ORGANISM="Ceratium fusus, Strain PA161109" /LENGTH=55 /DNA_ID=CAMNT_0013710823 /DNA_START=11 /DNA_END=178 /DNA_ORIENTATION=-